MKQIYIDCGYHRGGGYEDLLSRKQITPDALKVGFEPNPRLKQACPDWVHQAAVWTHSRGLTLHIQDPADNHVSEMGSTVVPGFKDGLEKLEESGQHISGAFTEQTSVPSVDLSSLISAYRFLNPDQIVVKIDIEGAEDMVIPHLIHTRAAAFIDIAFIEWHDWSGIYSHERKDYLIAELTSLGVDVRDHQ